MFQLTYFKATNVIGFMSGLGKRTFELDLTEFKDKDIICIIGDNAKGKSTFLSLIHPWHLPTDNRPKFIIEGKEGTIIREYTSDDGTIMISHCVYKPKSDGGHGAKCYLKRITKKGETELNPNGNIASYYSLLYAYMGLSKDYINFASYNDSVAGIVKMTDSDRKNNVNSLIPNTKRFDVAYDTVNAKYKELRNIIRNVAQKINNIRDEESLQSDLDHLSRRIKEFTKEREDIIKYLAKHEEKLSELTNNKSIEDICHKYHTLSEKARDSRSKTSSLQKELFKIYDNLSIKVIDDVIVPEAKNATMVIVQLEKDVTKLESSVQTHQEQIKTLSTQLKETEATLMDNQSVLYSIQTQDIKELRRTRDDYLKQIDELRYTKVKNQYKDMTYDGAISVSKIIAMVDSMTQALYDEYGQLVSDYFDNIDDNKSVDTLTNTAITLSATIETSTQKKDNIYRQLIEKKQYLKFQEVLNQRPKTCRIDSCPFISNALKWSKYTSDIDILEKEYQSINLMLDKTQKSLNDIEKQVAIVEDGGKLYQYIKMNEAMLTQYLSVDLKQIIKSIARCNWSSVLSILKIKEIASILSEKDLYNKIKNQLIPEIDHNIKLAEVYGSNRDMILHQIDQLKETENALHGKISYYKNEIENTLNMLNSKKYTLDNWKRLSDIVDKYNLNLTICDDTTTEISKYSQIITEYNELHSKIDKAKQTLKSTERILEEDIPEQERIKLNLHTLVSLKKEKDTIEKDFTVVEIMRSIIQPGKGLRKELLNIYMFDIYQIANKLLLETFNGNLYLKEFIITDKEFTIPYVYNGSEGIDISFASSSQQSTISIAISLAILSKVVDKYGIFTGDEIDAPLSKVNKEVFVDIMATQMQYIGLKQVFMITHSPDIYEQYDVGFIQFPGVKLDGNKHDIISIS